METIQSVYHGPILDDGKIVVRMYDKSGREAEQYEGGICVFAKYLLDDGYIKDDEFVLADEQGGVEMHFFNKDMAHFFNRRYQGNRELRLLKFFFS